MFKKGNVGGMFILSGIFICIVYNLMLSSVVSMRRSKIYRYNTIVLASNKTSDTSRIRKSRVQDRFIVTASNKTSDQKSRIHIPDCKKLIAGDKKELQKVLKHTDKEHANRIRNRQFLYLTKNCTFFRMSRHYDVYPVSDVERKFPIAYSVLLYKDVDQAERLLRAIYRQTNVYCFHVDKSSDKTVHEGIDHIAKCFDNVFVVSKKEDVVYKGFSRLQADLNCMKDLIKNKRKWKYLINLPSQQFPLKTNLEIVKILKVYNGANDIEGITNPRRMMRKRFQNRTAPPYGVTIVKGSAYGIFSRKMVYFILNDEKAHGILEWIRTLISPDEYYWAILNHNKILNSPGGYWGNPNKKPWLAAYAAWENYDQCHGKFVRGVCVFGVGDLPELVSKKQLFANKLHIDYQPFTLRCLEEWLFNKTMKAAPFDMSYYKQLPFINKNRNSGSSK